MSGIVCAGNWILDIVHVIDRWPGESELVTIGQEVEGIGGGAANVLLALQAMGVGVPLYAMGLLGRDAARPAGASCRRRGQSWGGSASPPRRGRRIPM